MMPTVRCRGGQSTPVVCLLSVLAFCWFVRPLPAFSAGNPSEPLFSVSFEDSFDADFARGAGSPTRTRGFSFIDGVKGRAVLIAPGGELRYGEQGNLDKDKGTLILWFRPSWRISDPGLHFLFREEDLTGSGRNLFVLHTYPGWVQFPPGDPGGLFRKGQVFWQPGEWHQVAIAWDHKRGTRLYLDGRAVSHNLYDRIHIEEPFSWDAVRHEGFILGDGQELPSDGLFAAGETAFDEFTILGQVLGDREVLIRYCEVAGFPDVYLPWNAFPPGRKTPSALRVVNPCPEAPMEGSLHCRIAGAGGETLAETLSPRVRVVGGEGKDLPFLVPALAPGEYEIFATWNHEARSLRRLKLWVYPPMVRRGPGDPSSASIHPAPASLDSGDGSVDRQRHGTSPPAPGPDGSGSPPEKEILRYRCAQDRNAGNFCADKGFRTVSSPIGDYLETGSRQFSRFGFRFSVQNPHVPHRLVIVYPDDRERIFDIIVNSPRFPGVYDVGTGMALGRENLLSGKLQEHPILFWPREQDNAVELMTWEEGKPAAAAEIVVEEISGGLQPLSFEPPPPGVPERRVGLYWEDPRFDATLGWPGEKPEGFDRAVGNLMEYMQHVGLNTLMYPTVTYGGPFFSSETEGFRGSNRYGSHPLNFVEILLSRCREAGVSFFAVFNMGGTIRLIDRVQEDPGRMQPGETGLRTVTREDRVTSVWGENLHSLFNPLDPTVQGEVKELVLEHVRRFGSSEAFRGVSFHLAAENLPWLGSLDQVYDDETIARFGKETGAVVPAGPEPNKRFSHRYKWIMENRREDWIHWRCGKIRDFYSELATLLRADGRNRELVLSVFMPCGRGVDVARWALAKKSVESILLEAGFDAEMLAEIPGVRLQRFLHPSDYRRIKCDKGDKDLTALYARDIFFDDEALGAFQTRVNTGVNLFHVYFENERGETPIPGYWWEPQRWRVSTVAAGGVSYLEYPAHALASFDPWLLTFSGFQIPTIGHEEQLKPFIKALRALPAVPFQTVKGLEDPVVMRHARCGNRLYLYLVNREPVPVRVRWFFGGKGAGDLKMRDLVAEAFLRALPAGSARPASLEMQPYELRSFWVQPATVEILDPRADLPAEVNRRLEQEFSLLQSKTSSFWEVGARSPELERTQQALTGAFAEDPRPYSRIRHLLERYEVQRVMR